MGVDLRRRDCRAWPSKLLHDRRSGRRSAAEWLAKAWRITFVVKPQPADTPARAAQPPSVPAPRTCLATWPEVGLGRRTASCPSARLPSSRRGRHPAIERRLHRARTSGTMRSRPPLPRTKEPKRSAGPRATDTGKETSSERYAGRCRRESSTNAKQAKERTDPAPLGLPGCQFEHPPRFRLAENLGQRCPAVSARRACRSGRSARRPSP